MAGHGPPPKDPSRRVRHGGKGQQPLKVVAAPLMDQPVLPTFEIERNGELTEFVWPARTLEWWQMWGDSPLSAGFTATDWSELLDTALLHAEFWGGRLSLAAELRLRVAKYGATPEDRARLRIQFAAADEADAKRPEPKAVRERRVLHALPAVGD